MVGAFLTSVSAKFNPFLTSQRMPRIFLSMLPPDARSTMKIQVSQLPRSNVEEKGSLSLTFKDGKEMTFDPEKTRIKDVLAEVNRYTRILARKEDLANS